MHHFFGHFECSKGQPLWLWMDTSLLLWYQRNGGQALPTPLRAPHKRCCWWPERRGLVRASPVPQPRHSLFSLFCLVTLCRGPGRGRTKGSRFRFYLKVFGVCATPKPSLVLGRGWPRTGELGRRGVGVSVTDGLRVVGAFVDGGDCLNRDVLPTSLCVSAAWGWVCGGCNGGFD